LLGLVDTDVSFSQTNAPTLSLDHIILWTKKGAPDTSLFQRSGFTLDQRTMVHTGFGTGGRYIFFYNVYIELLYVNDTVEFNTEFNHVSDSHRSMWRENAECPFGLGLGMVPYDTTKIPFAAKSLQAPWMKPNSSLFVDADSYTHPQEPMVIVVPDYLFHRKFDTRRDIENLSNEANRIRLLAATAHVNGVKKLTAMKITCPAKQLSAAAAVVKNIDHVEIITGTENLMELTFDNNEQHKTSDWRPQLPVVIKY
jgi:Glyoxalase-like domain